MSDAQRCVALRLAHSHARLVTTDAWLPHPLHPRPVLLRQLSCPLVRRTVSAVPLPPRLREGGDDGAAVSLVATDERRRGGRRGGPAGAVLSILVLSRCLFLVPSLPCRVSASVACTRHVRLLAGVAAVPVGCLFM